MSALSRKDTTQRGDAKSTPPVTVRNPSPKSTKDPDKGKQRHNVSPGGQRVQQLPPNVTQRKPSTTATVSERKPWSSSSGSTAGGPSARKASNSTTPVSTSSSRKGTYADALGGQTPAQRVISLNSPTYPPLPTGWHDRHPAPEKP